LKVIAALEKKTALHAQDLARLEPQTMQIISLEITGRRIAGPDAVGDALRWLVKAAKEEVRSGSWSIERIVGRFGGFELGLLTERGETVPRLHLSSRCVYNAESYQTGPAWVAGIVAALESVPNTTPTPPHSWRCAANGWTTSGWNWPARSSMRTAWRSRSRGSDSC